MSLTYDLNKIKFATVGAVFKRAAGLDVDWTRISRLSAKNHIATQPDYEVFNQHRLAIEAKQEALADDRELKRIQGRLEKKKNI